MVRGHSEMFSELNNLMQIENCESLCGKVIGLADSSADGTFLIHHFLTSFLKAETPVCFLALTQSFGHYNSVTQKFGVSLMSCKEKGYLRFIEGLTLIRDDISGGKGHNPLSGINSDQCLHDLKCLISDSYDELKKTNKKCPVVMIDNLSLLIDIGYATKHVTHLAHSLSIHILKQSNADCVAGALVLFVNNGLDVGDDDKIVLWNYLQHISEVTAEISGLESGYCKEVHGKIKVSWRDSILKIKSRTMQFKVMEKNVALFAVGMSSAVL